MNFRIRFPAFGSAPPALKFRRLRSAGIAFFLLAFPRHEAAAEPVVAVLSSDLAYYQEAFQGFQKAWAGPVAAVNLKSGKARIDSDTRVVVAFGAKAALQPYPDGVTVIYCMAPGTQLKGRRSVKI